MTGNGLLDPIVGCFGVILVRVGFWARERFRIHPGCQDSHPIHILAPGHFHRQEKPGVAGQNTLQEHLAQIGHVQLADNPGRHEPGSGEINFPFLLQHLDRIGYEGWVGCEYKPAGRTEDSFGWLETWR